MAKQYHQSCPVAKTLEVIGELLPSGDVPGRAVVRPFRLVH